MQANSLNFGNIRVTRLVESDGPLLRPAEIYPDSTPELIQANRDWLAPRFYDPVTDRLVITIQSFLIQADGKNILVDTCVGDCKDRAREDFHQQRWNWLQQLSQIGVGADQIDVAISTHMHVDHVGWHTRWDGSAWIPTFPNARYLFTSPEWEYWKDNEGHPSLVRSGDYIGDSIWPLFHAGVADVVPMDHELAPGIQLIPLEGHTPGHVGVRLDTLKGTVILSADLFHTPLQCCHPTWNTRFCLNPDQSRATRINHMEKFANDQTLLMPAHFPSPNLGRLQRVAPHDEAAKLGHQYRYVFCADGEF